MNGGRLSVGDSGDAVTRLHEELGRRGLEMPTEEVRGKLFGPATRQALQAWQRDNALDPTGLVDQRTAALLAMPPPSPRAQPNGANDGVDGSSEPPTLAVSNDGGDAPALHRSGGDIEGTPNRGVPWTLTGRVADGNGRAVAGAHVRAFSVRLRGEDPIGEAVTDAGGRYAISGDQPRSVRAGVYDDQGRQLAVSSVRFPAGEAEDIDLVLPVAEPGSEYERYLAQLKPVLTGIPLREVSRADLEFLSGDTQIPAAHLGQLAEAARRSAADAPSPRPDLPSLPAEVWYAWQRSGVDTSPGTLWQRPTDELIAALQTAADRGVVSSAVADRIEELRPQIRAVRADSLLDRPPVPGGGSLRDLLASAPEPLSPPDQHVVAEVLAGQRPTPDQLAGDLTQAGLSSAQSTTVVRTMRLAELADGHPPLVAALQPLAGGGTSLRDLATVAPESWLDLAYRHGVPAAPLADVAAAAGMASTPVNEAGYAAQMRERVEALHPTATLHARLQDGSVTLPVPGGDLVGPFLAANPGFDVVTTPIDQFLDERPLDRDMDRSQLGPALHTMRRLQAVTSTWDQVDALMDLGLESSSQIAAVEPARLAADLRDRMPAGEAHAISARAVAVQDTTAAVVGVLRSASAGIEALPMEEPSGRALERNSSLRSLFGSLEGCACGHCRSVLSPAAYLVDLLEFLREGAPAAFSALLTRRPDLADLELSCENGETEIPAVDLALEILENAAALPLTVPLPAGTDVTAALNADTLPDVIAGVLARTALDVGSGLHAAKEPQELQRGGFTAWTVTDRARRWTLHQTDEALNVSWSGLGRLGSVPLAGLNLGSVRSDLDLGTLPGLLDDRLRTLISTDPLTRAGMQPLRVETIEPGRSWRVSYLAEVQVIGAVSAGDSGTLTFSTAGGATIAQKTFSATAVTATMAALAAGRAGGMLTALLSGPGTYAVSAGASPGTSRLTKTVARLVLTYTPATLTVAALTYQSTPGQGDLTASPGNRNLAAYEHLRDARFPWTLPLHLPLAEMRALLDRAGCSRRELLELWLSANARTSEQVAYELLGASAEQVRLLTNPAAEPEIWAIWGVEPTSGTARITDASTSEEVSGPPATVLSRVSLLMQQAGLTHAELLEVLATRFVRAGGVVSTIAPLIECRPSKMTLDPVNAPLLDRIHRFVRVWRMLGWTPADVDAALAAFTDDGALTPAALLRLSDTVRLQEALGLSVAELTSWWHPPAADAPPAWPPASPAGDDRANRLARVLGLPAADYQRALALTGVDPFASPAAVLELRDAVDTMRDSGFSVRELHHLSRHRLDIHGEADEPLFGDAGLAIALTDAQVAGILAGFLAAVAAVRDQVGAAAPDPSIPLRAGLAALGWYPLLVDEVLDDLQGGLSVPLSADAGTAAGIARAFAAPPGLTGRVAVTGGTLTTYDHLPVSAWDRNDPASLYAALPATAVPAQRTAFDAAVGTLRTASDQRRDRLTRRLRWARLPALTAETGAIGAGVAIPERLAARCRVEPAATGAGSRIIVAGWVDAADATALERSLGTVHAAAIADLRTQSDAGPRPPSRHRLLTEGAITALLSGSGTAADRCRAVLLAVVRQEQMIAGAAQLGQALQLPPDTVTDLLLDLLSAPAASQPGPALAQPAAEVLFAADFADGDPRAIVPAARYAAQFALIRRLNKISVIASRFALDAGQLAGFAGTGPIPAGRGGGLLALDLNRVPSELTGTDSTVPFASWRRLVALAALRRRTPGGAAMMDAYMATLAAAGHPEDQRRAAALAVVADAIGQPRAAVTAAADQVLLSGLEYRDPLFLESLLALLTTLARLGVSAAKVPTLIAFNPTFTEATAGAELARSLLRARYPGAAWNDVIRPVSDQLRIRQRDALVAYLLWRDRLPSPDALYERYLIDTQTAPCLTTTRVLQATAAVQLFVNRCLLNLEPAVPASSINRGRWDWMKAYRVWEANRKVFLWPQMWLRPELRDDASDAFRAVESALGQEEPSAEASCNALHAYLDDLVELSQLTVLGIYEDSYSKPGTSDLYMLGRTANPPHRYYWRVCQNIGGTGLRWRPWERVDLDIAGSHVMAFVLGGDLHLAWVVFRKNQSQPPGEWEVQLAWARRTSRGWSEKKLSRDVVTVPALAGIDEHRMFTFNVSYAELAEVNTAGLPGVPEDAFRTPAALVAMFRAEDSDAIATRSDVIASGGQDGIPGMLNFSCDVLFEDTNGTRWFAAGVMISIHWGRWAGGHGVITDERGHAALFFAVWPRQDLDDLIDEQHRPAANDLGVDLWVKTGPGEWQMPQVLRGKVDYPKDAAYAHPIKTWSLQLVVRPPEGMTAPIGRINPERELRMVSNGTFLVFAGRDAEYRRGWAGEVNPPDGGEAYDNGFREIVPRGVDEVTVRDLGTGVSTKVFAATPGRFWMVASSPVGDGYWHYQDGASRCLLRVLPDNRMVVIADGNRLGVRFRAEASSELSKLYSPAEQKLNDAGKLIADGNRPVPRLVTAAEPAFPQASLLEQGVSFDRRSPYGVYNWELFLHVPLLIADYLSREQRFADAQQWLRLVFDPTSDDARAAATFDARLFWRFLPFRQGSQPDRIEDLLAWLANPTVPSTDKDAFRAQIELWRENPFRPHEIARLRTGAYQWDVLFAYLDNLFAWGDDRFRRDTRESLVEATMLYIEAAKLLGPRPRTIRPQLQPLPMSYRALKGRWDKFGDAWYSVADSPYMRLVLEQLERLRQQGWPGVPGSADAIAALSGIGITYFCVPPNDKLVEYWNTVEDRLFKIRHCQNIDGIERQLPFYSPPIDPALLVQAVAAGVDIDQAVTQAGGPVPAYRFTVLSQKATELCAEVKGLGAEILSLLEKKDAEQLARLRSGQEVALLELVEQVRTEQVNEADAGIDSLKASREVAASRYRHFQYLLTGQPGKEPAQGSLITEAPSTLALASPQPVEPDVRGLGLLQTEQDQFVQLRESRQRTQEAAITNALASVFFLIGSYPTTSFVQGAGHAMNAMAALSNAVAGNASAEAGRDALIAGYQRRRDDWIAQSNAALREMAQIDKQLAAAGIRAAIAAKELANHRQQMANARTVDQFMRDKYTSTQLYAWMSGQVGSVYFAAYQLALDVARQAERAFRYELAQPDATFVRPRYWDSLHRGLSSGEQLAHDLKRMEVAYLERNRREHELTRSVSLRQLDPVALLQLRAEGACQFELPEWLFDLDSPGHYLRRLKTVGLSIPCVVGPHAGVHARLTLLHSEMRHRPDPRTPYTRDRTAGAEDNRFADDFALAETVVTSGTVDATGVWEPSLRDERRMPFEGRGAITSTWRLELPNEFRSFDYDTISDVLLTVRYSARDGGSQLRDAAVSGLREAFKDTVSTSHAVLISLSHEFPSQWERLTASGDGPRSETITITRDWLPYLVTSPSLTVMVTRLDAFGVPAAGRPPTASPPALPGLAIGGTDVTLVDAEPIGAITHRFAEKLAVAVPADAKDSSASWIVKSTAGALTGLRDVLLVATYSADRRGP